MVQRGLQREREKGDVSRSSANDKHLCLISVIGMEGPDKSHRETGSREERQTGTQAARGDCCRSRNYMLIYILSYLLSDCSAVSASPFSLCKSTFK